MRRIIWLQTPTVSWLVGGTISFSYRIYMGLMIIHTAEPLVPESSAYEVELAIEKRKSHGIKIDNSSLERVVDFKYLGTTLTNQNSIQEGINKD
jgi:hypothetical protein